MLIDRARFHGQVLMIKCELDELARRQRKDGLLRIDASLELGPNLFEHDPEARRMDHAMPGEHELAEMAVGAVCHNEIGIEEQQKGFRHLGAEVQETAVKRLSQHYPIVAGPV